MGALTAGEPTPVRQTTAAPLSLLSPSPSPSSGVVDMSSDRSPGTSDRSDTDDRVEAGPCEWVREVVMSLAIIIRFDLFLTFGYHNLKECAD